MTGWPPSPTALTCPIPSRWLALALAGLLCITAAATVTAQTTKTDGDAAAASSVEKAAQKTAATAEKTQPASSGKQDGTKPEDAKAEGAGKGENPGGADADKQADSSKKADAGKQAGGGSESTTVSNAKSFFMFVLVFALTIILPVWLGGLIARRARAKEYAWRIGLSLASIACALLVLVRAWDPEQNRLSLPLGVDLKGGVILIYEVKEGLNDEATEEPADGSKKQAKKSNGGDGGEKQQVDMGQLCQAIKNRIDPAGTQEIVVRPYGTDHVEVIIPKVDPIEVDYIKQKISTAGALEFRIVANTKDHMTAMAVAREQADSSSVTVKTRRQVIDADGTEIAFWARVAREDKETNGVKPFKIDVFPGREMLRIAAHATDPTQVGRIIELPQGVQIADMAQFALYLENQGVKQIDVLMYKDEYNVTGSFLGIVKPDYDEQGHLCVSFTLRGVGVNLFSRLTGQNVPDPDTGFARRLGIVLDNTLLSAPNIISRISQQGQITGKFSQQEIEFLVGILRSGRLPAALDPQPISENNIGSELGEETIRKGQLSIGAALASVLVFILIYYRFAGIVACVALLLNLVFILALMVLLKAPLTLPGLAGLVLTVGMSVDANVLIFERIREELRRGAALRMAIRNGFSRATTTIVDANLTTLITAIVLYLIGTDQIKGFAVTLIFGILMSMYTAIFISRIVFELAERQRRLKKLTMMELLTKTDINFLNKRLIAAAVSITLIVIGIGATFQRGRGLFDIDFNGGTSVTFILRQPMAPDKVRQSLEQEFAQDKERVQFTVNEMTQEGRDAQTRYRVTSSLTNEQQLIDRIVAALHQSGGSTLLETYQVQVTQVKAADEPMGADAQANSSQGTLADLEFEHAINAATLVDQIRQAADGAEVKMGDVMLSAFDESGSVRFVDPSDLRPLEKWQVRLPADMESAKLVLAQLQREINTRPVIPEASVIGGKVAENMQNDAMWALLTSLIGIIAYIWFRFQRLQYGLAAVVALVHDVLITLGAIAVSKWLAPALGILQIDEFKISLPVVAAFLTIVGYSLNDTIVVFDRIREVRGKSPRLTAAMINTSINQTLSRTILTSLTTLLVVAILYFFGGDGIHAFAFALVVGVIVGTYSSIFVASPALLWMLEWSYKRQEMQGGKPQASAAAL